MFRIECFCDDSKLPKLLWALTELGAYNVTSVPVADSKPNGHATPRKNISREEMKAAFLAFIKQHKLKEIRAPQAREFAASLGLEGKSYSRVLSIMRDEKLLTRVMPKGKPSASFWRVRAP